MNLTKACSAKNDRSCLVTCQDPSASNRCVILETQLIDGSPCGYGGTCLSGSCKSGSWQATFMAWYRDNLQISIPVTVIVGLIVLLILWAIIRSIMRCCHRPRTPPKTIAPVLINTRAHQDVPLGRGPEPVYANQPPRSMRPPLTAYATRSHGSSRTPSNSSRAPPGGGSSASGRPPRHRASNRDQWVDETAYNGNGYPR